MEKLIINHDFGNGITTKVNGNFFEYSFGNKEETLDKLELIQLAKEKAAKVIGINATAHSNKVITVNAKNIKNNTRLLKAGIDGVILTNLDQINNKVALILGVADCGAISIVSEKGDIVGLIHAGHKGTANDIVGNLINQLEKINGNIETFKVYVAPMAGKNFEFEENLYFKNFQKICDKYGLDSGKYFQPTTKGKGNLDLKNMLFDILNSKIPHENIIFSEIETNSTNNSWPSYRQTKTNRRILVSLEN